MVGRVLLQCFCLTRFISVISGDRKVFSKKCSDDAS